MASAVRFVFHPLALAAALTAAPTAGLAQAQAQPTDAGTLPAVTVRSGAGTGGNTAEVSGFADQALANSPFNATLIGSDTIAETGARGLRDLYRLDASVSDAYNAVGYYDYASVRGYVLDHSYNYRREGLPISAETSLPIDHLERVELLKGTSGIQAGTSAPGGLFNAVVKRPTDTPLRRVRTEVNSEGNALAHLDLGGRLAEGDLGYRLNVLGERLNTEAPGTKGWRGLLALAMDARLSRDSLLEAEFELSRRRQASVPGLSLLGDALPPADPRININTQPWSRPTDFRNFSGSLRYTQAINPDWNWQAQFGWQSLDTNDYLAYPYGCWDAGSGNYYADRYCPDGGFDLYDFRSLGEERRSHSAQWRVNGQFQTGSIGHKLSAGVLLNRFTLRGQAQADGNAATGTGNIFTLPALPPLPEFTDPFTNRSERSTELFVTDVVQWTPALQTWLGLRHTRLDRQSVRSNGSRATDYTQDFSTPWLALAYKLDAARTAYASWGQGVESEVAAGRARYSNANQALPALKSEQWEIGLKSDDGRTRWQITAFDIARPVSGDRLNDPAGCSDAAPGSCTRIIDGEARHRGLELGAGQRSGPWALDASFTWLDAERQGSTLTPELNGRRVTNVPRWVLRANASRAIESVPGLRVGAHLSHEARRAIVPDNSLMLPSWTRVDATLRYDTRVQGHAGTWTVGIYNLFDRRYFQESPYQYEHIYLFPGATRTLRVAFEANF